MEIELWAEQKLDWLRQYLPLSHGIPSHDTFGRLFRLIERSQFEAAFRRWMQAVLPAFAPRAEARVVAIDGKTSRRSSGVDATAPHLVSAFAAGLGVVLGQRMTAENSNEITAIPELLATFALTGSVVAIDAMGTQTAIAEAIGQRGADHVLAVKDNQPRVADSVRDFWSSFGQHPATLTPHSFTEEVEKTMGGWKLAAATPSANSIVWPT